ncbi:hypothetical protein N8996_04865 [Candidatus Poseidonia alphae]|nr:hypothetical protein [Candidatus Poseidonia alphae]
MNEPNLKYEIKESLILKNHNDIDSMMNNENFFSDIDEFKDEFLFFEEDNLIAQQIDYSENYTLKMLTQIASYYKLNKRKVKKDELIELILSFENDPENSEKVYNRKRMWHYLNELKSDSYFSKYVIFYNS